MKFQFYECQEFSSCLKRDLEGERQILLNTGNLSLIGELQVRDTIIHYYQNLKSMVYIIENNNSRVIDQQISKQFYDTNLLDFDLSYSAEKYLPAILGVKDMREVFTNLPTTSPEENPSINLIDSAYLD